MKFAHFSHIWAKPNMTPHQRYEELWRELALCDGLGFDYGFCVEHHCRPDESWISSPSLYAVGAGARTKRMRVGPMGYIVPLYHPLRLAEEIAIVDQMLGGRMECGLVPGINPDYFRPFGLDYGQRKSPTLEFIDYLRAAYGETQPYTFKSESYETAGPTVLAVQPLQKPHPPLWMMSRDPQTLEFCAQKGINPGYFLIYPRKDAAPALPQIPRGLGQGRTCAQAEHRLLHRRLCRRDRREGARRGAQARLAAPTKASCRRRSPARASRSASRSTPSASSAAASPAPPRSWPTCSTPIT